MIPRRVGNGRVPHPESRPDWFNHCAGQHRLPPSPRARFRLGHVRGATERWWGWRLEGAVQSGGFPGLGCHRMPWELERPGNLPFLYFPSGHGIVALARRGLPRPTINPEGTADSVIETPIRMVYVRLRCGADLFCDRCPLWRESEAKGWPCRPFRFGSDRRLEHTARRGDSPPFMTLAVANVPSAIIFRTARPIHAKGLKSAENQRHCSGLHGGNHRGAD